MRKDVVYWTPYKNMSRNAR